MDLSKFFEVPSKPLENIFLEVDGNAENTNTEDVKQDKRQFVYKNKRGKFSNKESRVLRSMQATRKRRDQRQERHFAARSKDLNDASEEGQNKENLNESCSPKKSDGVESKSRARRKKLNEYLDQKKKLEDMKRKMAKPAFKVGIVHHSLTPDDFNNDNVFSTTMCGNKKKTLNI